MVAPQEWGSLGNNVTVNPLSSCLACSPVQMVLLKVLPEVCGPGKHLGQSLVSAPLPEQAAVNMKGLFFSLP